MRKLLNYTLILIIVWPIIYIALLNSTVLQTKNLPIYGVIVTGDSRDGIELTLRSLSETLQYPSKSILSVVIVSNSQSQSTIEIPEKLDRVHFLNAQKHIGVAAQRAQAVEFLNQVRANRAAAGTTTSADLSLLFLREYSVLQEGWSSHVQEELSKGGARAEAVSFDIISLKNLNSSSLRSSSSTPMVRVQYDNSFHPVWEDTSNNKNKYSQLAGAVTAMRLSTFHNLVVTDFNLKSSVAADMQWSFNLWMCGDGVKVLSNAVVAVDFDGLSNTYSKGMHEISEDEIASLKKTWVLPSNEASYSGMNSAVSRCRTMDWFVENINPRMQIEKIKKKVRTPRKNAKSVATDENGNPGYIHDETALRERLGFDPASGFGEKVHCPNDNHKKMLTQKVQIANIDMSQGPKIFCVSYTVADTHDRITAVQETWAKQCDGFIVPSTATDKKYDAVNIQHIGAEEYNNIWQKIRSVWMYVYENYFDDYDYFHIGGDDLYLIVPNLKYYLMSEEISSITDKEPLFLGRRFAEQGNTERIFNSGGSGYTMNKLALKLLYEQITGPNCFPNLHTFAEDVMTAACFRKNNVFPRNTLDEEGGERYMPFAPGHHLTYQPPKDWTADWYTKYMIPLGELKTGLDHCAKYSVAFHYIKGPLMKQIHANLYGLCKE